MTEDEELVAALRRVQSTLTLNCRMLMVLVVLVVVAQVMVLVIAMTRCGGSGAVQIEANPNNSNQIEVNGEAGVIEDRAERRGWFTKAEFAELLGVSVRTLERRIERGQVDPPPVKDEAGRVVIDLDATLTRH